MRLAVAVGFRTARNAWPLAYCSPDEEDGLKLHGERQRRALAPYFL